jgi:hypothetical protein
LVRRLLNGHPGIFCPAEIKFYKDLLGQFPDDPLAHGRLGNSMRALGISTETWLDEFGRALCRCYEIAACNAGKRRWADKSPENSINVGHWDRLLGGRMAFVLVVRHPLDIMASMAEIGMNKVIPVDAAGRAAHVRDYIDAGLAFIDRHPERGIILRYEHLVADPQRALNELMPFLSESYDEAMIANLNIGSHGEGLEDPKIRSHPGVSSQNVGRWRRDLTQHEVSVAAPLLARICERLTYEI